MSESDIQKLNTKLTEKEDQYEEARRKATEIQKRCEKLKLDIHLIQQGIKSLKDEGHTTVTEHARVRYLERVEDIDMSEVDNNILTDQIKEWINTLGDGDYPLQNGHYIKVVDNTVVTVYPSK